MQNREIGPPPQAGKGAEVFFWIFAVSLFAVGGILTVVDAILMAMGANQMAPGESGPLMMLAAIAGAIFKAAWMSMAREYFMRRMFMMCAVAIVSGAALHVFSMTAMTGLAAVGRDTTLSERGRQLDVQSRAAARYREAQERVRALRAVRAESAVRADIVRAEADLRAAETDLARGGWRDRTLLRDRRDAQRTRLDGLNAELAEALTAINAAAEVRVAKAELDGIQAPEHKDAQAAAIARYPLGLSEADVSMLLPLMPSLLVEWGGGVAWLFAATFAGFAIQARRERAVTKGGPCETVTKPARAAASKVRTAPAVVLSETESTEDQPGTNVTTLRPETREARPAETVVALTRSRASADDVARLRGSVLLLAAEGRGERYIADAVGLSKTAVHNIIERDRAGLKAPGGLSDHKSHIKEGKTT